MSCSKWGPVRTSSLLTVRDQWGHPRSLSHRWAAPDQEIQLTYRIRRKKKCFKLPSFGVICFTAKAEEYSYTDTVCYWIKSMKRKDYFWWIKKDCVLYFKYKIHFSLAFWSKLPFPGCFLSAVLWSLLFWLWKTYTTALVL